MKRIVFSLFTLLCCVACDNRYADDPGRKNLQNPYPSPSPAAHQP